MHESAASIWRTLRLLLFAPHCQVCREPASDPLCGLCRGGFLRLSPPLCEVCGDGVENSGCCAECLAVHPQFDSAVAPYVYEGALRRAVHLLKYRGRSILADTLGQSLADFVVQSSPFPHPDAIVPVPLHGSRLLERGFNQALLLASPVARRLEVPLRPHWLRRIRRTAPQRVQHGSQRQNNVADAFAADPVAAGKRIWIVDDVITTGETLDACAAALRSVGAAEIYALALGRTLRNTDPQGPSLVAG